MGKEGDSTLANHRRVQRRRELKEADYQLIRHCHEEKGWPIQAMCKILEISRAAYYKWLHREPGITEKENEELLDKIDEIAKGNNRLFGYRKMTMVMNKNSDKVVNHKRVYRLMCIHNLGSVYRKKKHHWKKSTPAVTAQNKLARDFNADAPNQKWGTDITELQWPGIAGKVYISTIVDHYDRYPVAVLVSRRNDTALTDQTLKLALEAYPGGASLFHSDRGFQYTRAVYQNTLKIAGMEASMSRVSRCIDNGMVEGFQGQIKDILRIRHPEISSYKELEAAIYETYEYYKNEYPQERFHGKTSGEVRAEAMAADRPEVYPIKPNREIQKFWKMVQEKKAARA